MRSLLNCGPALLRWALSLFNALCLAWALLRGAVWPEPDRRGHREPQTESPPPRRRGASHYLLPPFLTVWPVLLTMVLSLASTWALSGCGTQRSPAVQPRPPVPAELMRPPGKPLLLVPRTPASTSPTPGQTRPPTPAPVPMTASGTSA